MYIYVKSPTSLAIKSEKKLTLYRLKGMKVE